MSHNPEVANVSAEQLQEEEYIYDPDKQPDFEIVNGGSILMKFLRSIKPGADLVGALAPTFSLKPKSFLEWIADLLQPKDYLLRVAKSSSPENRFLKVMKYICEGISTMPQQGVQNVKGYNPILGEVFECEWKHQDSTTTFFAEQTSHHPPISCCYMENKKYGLQIEIVFQPKVKFVGSLSGPSVQSHIEGRQFIHVRGCDETYEVHFPHFVCRNLLFGGSYCELNDELVIESSNGMKGVINFKSKSKHKCTGKITANGKNLYRIEGVSNERLAIIKNKQDKASLLMDVSKIKTTGPKAVKPVAQQHMNESRRVWHNLTKHIYNKDLDEATKQKTRIEDAERTIRKERDRKGEKWEPKYFDVVKKNGKTVNLGNSTPYYRYKHFDKFSETESQKDE